jgi:diphthamide biosynthesis protein 2
LVDEQRGSDDQDVDKNGEDGEDNGDRPVFSLVTGTYRHPKRYGGRGKAFFSAPFLKLTILSEDQQGQIGGTSGAQSAVILRNQDSAITQLDIAAGKFSFTRVCSFAQLTVMLQGHQRTYHGLDMRIGQDAPSTLEQGRSGVARGYQDDIDRLS